MFSLRCLISIEKLERQVRDYLIIAVNFINKTLNTMFSCSNEGYYIKGGKGNEW